MEIIKNVLSLEEKVAQMLMFAFHGTEYNEQLDYLITKIKVGGIIHFARNLISPQQANFLNKTMQEKSQTKLFIGCDQEGGTVMRITKDVTPFPGAMALSATGEDISKLTEFVGTDLANMNFNMVFAPVGDVNNNPLNPVINSRSYSDKKEIVSKYATYAFQGFQNASILPTIKHFPGHGDTSVDSHKSLPYVNKSQAQLKRCEFAPFADAIKNGIDGVMVSHILYPALDNKYPATLSHAIMTKLLRKEMGFDGLIVSDSLTMGAINNNFTKKEVILKAVNGGMDLLIFCGMASLDEQKEIYKTFLELVKNNFISIERIDESVNRILRLKEKYITKIVDSYTLPSSEAIELGNKLSLQSITLVKDNRILPLKEDDEVLVIFPKIKLFSLVDNENQEYLTLGKAFAKQGFKVSEIIIGDDLANIKEIKETSSRFSKIIFATYNVLEGDYQTKVFSLLDCHKTVVVSLRSPYDVRHLDNVSGYVCLYEASELALSSFVTIALGLKEFNGKIPVKLD